MNFLKQLFTGISYASVAAITLTLGLAAGILVGIAGKGMWDDMINSYIVIDEDQNDPAKALEEDYRKATKDAKYTLWTKPSGNMQNWHDQLKIRATQKEDSLTKHAVGLFYRSDRENFAKWCMEKYLIGTPYSNWEQPFGDAFDAYIDSSETFHGNTIEYKAGLDERFTNFNDSLKSMYMKKDSILKAELNADLHAVFAPR